MKFREITLEDMHIFDKYKNICSDYLFSYLFMYKELYKLRIAETEASVIIHSGLENSSFYMPLGAVEQGIKAVMEYCRSMGIAPLFSKIPEDYKSFFEKQGFCLQEDRNSFDYIFRNSDFIEYKGKDFRNQRNNLYSYLRDNAPEFSTDIRFYIDKCKEFTYRHHNMPSKLQPTLVMLDNIDRFDLKGGVVLDQGEVAAFCLYEKVSEDMVLSHVELTDNSHRGVHAYLINELAKVIAEKYINKEDDMGVHGLRRFKEKYNPCKMLKKYNACLE